MSQNLKRAKLLHDAIHTILIQEWDPIGIKDIPEAQDEYDAYVPGIYKLLISRKPTYEVFEYLWSIETEYMSLCGDRQRTKQVAERLVDLTKKQCLTVLK